MIQCSCPKTGDVVYVFAPSNSMLLLSDRMVEIGVANLERLGFTVKFGEHVRASGPLGMASANDRLSDIYSGLRDPDVSLMMSVFGGYNSNQLFRRLDYSVLREFPKLWVGYSDISALLNSFYAMIGLPGICGMGFASFCDPGLTEEAINVFKQALRADTGLSFVWPARAAEDLWYLTPDLGPREWKNSDGPFSLHDGQAEGVAIGGNFDTLMSLAGTAHFPSLKGKLLFLESALDESPGKFLRLLTQLAQQEDFAHVNGIVFGKFAHKHPFQRDRVLFRHAVLEEIGGLVNIPILCNTPFSHVDPIFSFPIGCMGKMQAGRINLLEFPPQLRFLMRECTYSNSH